MKQLHDTASQYAASKGSSAAAPSTLHPSANWSGNNPLGGDAPAGPCVGLPKTGGQDFRFSSTLRSGCSHSTYQGCPQGSCESCCGSCCVCHLGARGDKVLPWATFPAHKNSQQCFPLQATTHLHWFPIKWEVRSPQMFSYITFCGWFQPVAYPPLHARSMLAAGQQLCESVVERHGW